jgi:hypothetical protein
MQKQKAIQALAKHVKTYAEFRELKLSEIREIVSQEIIEREILGCNQVVYELQTKQDVIYFAFGFVSRRNGTMFSIAF